MNNKRHIYTYQTSLTTPAVAVAAEAATAIHLFDTIYTFFIRFHSRQS